MYSCEESAVNIYQKSVFAALEEEGIKTIANTVNTMGVMGAGLALEFRLRYPEYFDDYHKRCASDLPGAGDVWLYRGSRGTPDIVSLFVKEDWKKPSKPEWIRKALERLSEIILSEGIERIALPLAGAGKGGINPKISLSITEEVLRDVPSEVYICLDKLPSETEKRMLSRLCSLDISALQKLGLTRAVSSRVIEALTKVTRFREILSYPGVGIKSYETLFLALLVHSESSSNQLYLF